MYCANCGKKIFENINFCPFCGTKIQLMPQDNEQDKTVAVVEEPASSAQEATAPDVPAEPAVPASTAPAAPAEPVVPASPEEKPAVEEVNPVMKEDLVKEIKSEGHLEPHKPSAEIKEMPVKVRQDEHKKPHPHGHGKDEPPVHEGHGEHHHGPHGLGKQITAFVLSLLAIVNGIATVLAPVEIIGVMVASGVVLLSFVSLGFAFGRKRRSPLTSSAKVMAVVAILLALLYILYFMNINGLFPGELTVITKGA